MLFRCARRALEASRKRRLAAASSLASPVRAYSNYSNVVVNADGSKVDPVTAPIRPASISHGTMADTPSGYVYDMQTMKFSMQPPLKKPETEEEFLQRKREEALYIRGLLHAGTSAPELDDLKLLVMSQLDAPLEALRDAKRRLEGIVMDFCKREDQCRQLALAAAAAKKNVEEEMLLGEGKEPRALAAGAGPCPVGDDHGHHATSPAAGGGGGGGSGVELSSPSSSVPQHTAAATSFASVEDACGLVEDLTFVWDVNAPPKPSATGSSALSSTAVFLKSKDVSVMDTNNARLVLSHCYRRLGDLSSAKLLIDQMREVDPGSTEALLALVELLVAAPNKCGLGSLGKFLTTLNEQELLVVYSFLAEMVAVKIGEGLQGHRKEGEATAMLNRIVNDVYKEIGPQHFSMFVQASMEMMTDQVLQVVKPKHASSPLRKNVLDLAIIHYKVFLGREVYKLTNEPIGYQFAMLHKLFWSLRFAKRRSESLGAAEKLISHYRKHREYLDGLSESFPLFFRETVFQYAFDRCNENVQISKQICMDLIEEYASFDTPWRLLAFVLMRNKEYDDAVIAAKKAVSLALWNKDNVLVLYKIYHTNNKFNVAAEVRERYVAMALVERELLAQNDDEIHTEALERFTADLQVLDTLIQEDDLVVSMGAALKEHQFRYDLAHLYSKNADEVEDRIRRKVHEAEAEAERLRGDQVECVAAGQVPLADSGSA